MGGDGDERLVEVDSRDYGCEFHHVQIYVDSLKPVAAYRELEDQLNALAHKGSFDPFSGGMRFLGPKALPERVEEGRGLWEELLRPDEVKLAALHHDDYSPVGQDIVEQMLVGLGWRVTASYEGVATRSVLVTSMDARGVKMVVTAPLRAQSEEHKEDAAEAEEPYEHFAVGNLARFRAQQHGMQGVAVLGFELPEEGALEATFRRYQKLHPRLLLGGVRRYEDTRAVGAEGKQRKIMLGSMTVLEAYAYYESDDKGAADRGTVVRFVHRTGSYASREGWGNPHGVLPGLEDVLAEFDGTSIPAYADHWVSNVRDRHSFLKTLKDVLGFTPKVDFNAGVVAAGRAKIESTVTGNNTAKVKATCNSDEILKDQSQIYLPINNALSEVGHVHGFLAQVGQGVQHLASRVSDLVGFIERVNNYRKITGRGLSFLSIPRSYYGRLAEADLAAAAGLDRAAAAALFQCLRDAQLCSSSGVVELDVTDERVAAALKGLTPPLPASALPKVCHTVRRARYSNLYALLRDHFDEATYIKIVTNQVLVDVQNKDVLFQIFTCNILVREPGQEAPFLEFIERVCSQKKLDDGTCAPIKPGCGGFGIRNFLTLFLSIEVSKAMHDADKAARDGDKVAEASARRRVELFTNQLDESNPVLTEISDAMTAEGNAREALDKLRDKSSDSARTLQETAAKFANLKEAGNAKLQALSDRYAKLMAEVK
jgi:hypothetical protein